MVIVLAMIDGSLRVWPVLAAVEPVEPAERLIEQLDPPRRAVVLMAILGLVLLGIMLVACIMIGGRWLRRVARHDHGPTRNTTHVENRRLRTALEPILPHSDSGETAVAHRKSDETVTED